MSLSDLPFSSSEHTPADLALWVELDWVLGGAEAVRMLVQDHPQHAEALWSHLDALRGGVPLDAGKWARLQAAGRSLRRQGRPRRADAITYAFAVEEAFDYTGRFTS
jgi:hypothetical protein